MKVVVLLLACASLVTSRRYHQRNDAETLFSKRTLTNPAEATADYWYEQARAAILARQSRHRGASYAKAKNVIMFLGDGMSIGTQTAARTLLGQRQGRSGEEEALSFEQFPTSGVSKTYCVDAQIADSACTATAYLCGVKNNEATLGVTAAVQRRTCAASVDTSTHVDSIAEWALADGRDAVTEILKGRVLRQVQQLLVLYGAQYDTRLEGGLTWCGVDGLALAISSDLGIVTTTRVTHASPAGAYAKIADRDWESDADVNADGFDTNQCPDIAQQLIHHYPGTHFKVILGGGRREFLPNTTIDEEGSRGYRTDGRNLINEWQAHKMARNLTHKYVWNRQELLEAADALPDYLLGLFESGHMQYHLEAEPTTEPTLAELTDVAIKSLSRNDKGFFLFVEGGRIDHAHHDNWPQKALDETIELAKAVERATQLVSEEDTLIVVTADHSHVMAINGYSPRGNDILGKSFWRNGDDDVPYMMLSYTNGPGAREHVGGIRPDVTQDSNFGDKDWRSHAEVPRYSETHGGDDVGVYAWGPHNDMFSGLYEQSQIPHLVAYASCLGRGVKATACNAAYSHLPVPFLKLFATLLAIRLVLR